MSAGMIAGLVVSGIFGISGLVCFLLAERAGRKRGEYGPVYLKPAEERRMLQCSPAYFVWRGRQNAYVIAYLVLWGIAFVAFVLVATNLKPPATMSPH